MNILFLARELPFPADTGVKMRAWLVLKSLAQKHKVTLVCFAEASVSVPGCDVVRAVKPAPKSSSRPYFRMLLGLFSSLPFAVKGRFSKEYDEEVQKALKDKKFDLIVCDSLYLALHVPTGVSKTLLNEHNIESVIIDRYAQLERNLFKKAYARYELSRMRSFEKKMWERFDISLVCSLIDKAEVEKRSAAKAVHVVANGVDVPATPNNREEPDTLIYTGLIGWLPNEDAVLYFAESIFPLIKQAKTGARWSVVGKGPSPKVKALAQDASIAVTGAVEDINAYISTASVVVVPLRVGSGTRLKILEAFAMGKAVVSTSVGCEGLDVTHGKDILIADSPQDFANAVIALLNDAQKRLELGANGRKLVEERYSYRVIGKEIEAIIEKI